MENKMLPNIIAVAGSGAIGIDPLDRDTWSGSSFYFFSECQRRGLLKQAVGVETNLFVKALYALRGYSRDPMIWRRKLYMDVGYRRALTKLLKTRLSDVCQGDLVLQLGSMFNSTEIVRGKCECWSYNDGNFAIASKSPHFPKEISQKKVDVTIQYEQEVVDSLSKILTMSEYLRKSFIEDYNCSPDKVSCIGCGINLDNLPEDKAKKISDRPNLLFIGVDFQRKGGQDTIDAFREVKSSFPEALLHIVGPREYRKEFDAVPDIRWHGFLDKNKPSELTQLDNLFREATLFIMPSRYEPFGIAPLEAMSYRLPCIVSNAWALPEIVSEGETGELVEPNNPVVLAEKIISLLGSHDRLLQYGQAGRKRVEEYFSWTKVVDRLEKILK